MSLKNAILSTFFSPLFPHSLPDHPSFLIVSTTGLGDTLWGIPALRALRNHFPKSSISLLTTPMGKDLLQEEKSLDEIILLSHPISLVRRYKKQFDVILFFHASQRFTIPLCRLLLPKWMVGTRGMQKGLDHLFSHVIPWERPHEFQRRMDLLTLFGIEGKELSYHLPLSPDEKNWGEQQVAHYKKPLIVLHPGAKDHYKCWPLESFLLLAKELRRRSMGTILFSRGKEDPPIPSDYPIIEDLPIRKYAAFLQASSLLITNDTGPMHLMASLQKPLIALFGPTDPAVCGPLSNQATVIKAEKSCTPCRKRKCADPFCLRQISVDDVVKRVQEILTCEDCPSVEYSSLCTLKLPSS